MAVSWPRHFLEFSPPHHYLSVFLLMFITVVENHSKSLIFACKVTWDILGRFANILLRRRYDEKKKIFEEQKRKIFSRKFPSCLSLLLVGQDNLQKEENLRCFYCSIVRRRGKKFPLLLLRSRQLQYTGKLPRLKHSFARVSLLLIVKWPRNERVF